MQAGYSERPTKGNFALKEDGVSALIEQKACVRCIATGHTLAKRRYQWLRGLTYLDEQGIVFMQATQKTKEADDGGRS